MGWFTRKTRDGADAPHRIVNDRGETLADDQGQPIEVTVPDAAAAPSPTTLLQTNLLDFDTDPRVVAMRAQIEAGARAKLDGEAEAFVAAEVLAHRCLPAGRDGLKALYLDAARADSASPPAQGQTGRVAALKSFCGGIPPHTLASHTIPANGTLPAGQQVLSNGETRDPVAEARAQNDRYYAAQGTPAGTR